MWVKICGNTNFEDAAHAVAAGADAVGFVFAQSKRRVTAAQVAAITHRLPASVERVGVFDTQDGEEIATAALEAGLTTVQLHTGLEDKALEQLAKRLARVRMIQTLHWDIGSSADKQDLIEQLMLKLRQVASLGIADRVLIDSRVGSAGGGTGVAYDWKAARSAFASAPDGLVVVAAGGLTPGNVAKAIAELKPWGVDVSSGVEAAPGRKDPALVEAFIKNARGAQTP